MLLRTERNSCDLSEHYCSDPEETSHAFSDLGCHGELSEWSLERYHLRPVAGARLPSNTARNLNPNQGKLRDIDGGRYTRIGERLMGSTVRRERLVGVCEGRCFCC